MCTKVPAQTTIPERARVRKYPLVEKDGWIWAWTGDADLADPADVPDTHWMNDPEWATVTHSVHFECRADLIHDNLLDLTHESFLHKTTVGDDYIYEHGITVEVEGTVVSVDRLMPSVEAPPLYARHHGHQRPLRPLPLHRVLRAATCTCCTPGSPGEGRPREEGYLIKVLNGITPIDEHNSWYYYAFSRNFAVDDDAGDRGSARGPGHRAAGGRRRPGRPGDRHAGPPGRRVDVLIAQDGGVAKARRIMATLIKREQAAAADRRPSPGARA